MIVLFKWKSSKEHEWRLAQDHPSRTPDWELHYLPVDSGACLRLATEYEDKFLEEIKRLTLKVDSLTPKFGVSVT